jgi:hypothetical protein
MVQVEIDHDTCTMFKSRTWLARKAKIAAPNLFFGHIILTLYALYRIHIQIWNMKL